MRSLAALVLAAGVLGVTSLAAAADDPHGEAGPAAAQAGPRADAAEHLDHADHGAGEHAEHGGHAAGGHHVPSFHDINWFYGVLGEREGVEPSFIYRPKGMPAPFGAYLANAALLYFILFRFLKKPVADGLKARKANILRGMDEAARMRKDAEARLADYEEKLAHIDEEIARVRQEMRADGERERARILSEAREQRERMERDARLLVEQELAAAREALSRETVLAALESAGKALEARLAGDDHQRLADEYLEAIHKAPVAGGAASPS
jgi:F-type H+-transporting ATPase subunit b